MLEEFLSESNVTPGDKARKHWYDHKKLPEEFSRVECQEALYELRHSEVDPKLLRALSDNAT